MGDNKQIRFVAVKPDGTIMGPVGKDRSYVEQCLIAGYSRATGDFVDDYDASLSKIFDLGYSIRECEIVLK